MEALADVIAIDVSLAGSTVTEAVPLTAPNVAVMVALPAAAAVVRPI
jgi:hypothetical protein